MGLCLSYCEGLNLGGATTWRLPNIKELESLVDVTKFYPALDTNMFPNAQTSYYWSSTTFASPLPADAWDINFGGGHGNVGMYGKFNVDSVRCVYGGHGPLNPTIAQNPMAATAGMILDQSGTGFTPNGTATLRYFNPAGQEILPAVTQPLDANGYFNIQSPISPDAPPSLYSWSAIDNATGKKSNKVAYEIIPTPASGCATKIWGSVTDMLDKPLTGVSVDIDSGVSYSTDTSGRFSIPVTDCGQYMLRATYMGNSKTLPILVGNFCGVGTTIKINTSPQTQGTPVIFVPGIMGSTQNMTWDIAYPELPRGPASRAQLHIFDRSTAWELLRITLEKTGFKVIDCPWDWRDGFTVATYRDFLKGAIEDALEYSRTGKVHIVAHSMGGLLVRQYIQSSEYGGEIDRLAMVGTPHLGSVNPYYIWEGGDPALLDALTEPWYLAWLNFYTNTLENLWEETYNMGFPNPNSNVQIPQSNLTEAQLYQAWRPRIRAFVHQVAPSVGQLMSTEEILFDGGPKTRRVANTLLEMLNMNVNIGQMTKSGANGTVRTRLFISKSERTISGINVTPTCALPGSIYEDGRP